MDQNKKYKVLIVDDDEFLLNMYAVKLSASGFDVITSSSTQEVLKKLRGGYIYDVLILDIVMPGMDGIELLEIIKTEKLIERTITIVLSNQGQPVDVDRAKRLGIKGYIVKASSIPSEVVEGVKKIIKESGI